MLFPQPLTAGSTIAVTALSSGIKPAHQARFDLVCEHLRSLGFELIIGEYLQNQHRGASATAELRAAELMRFLIDDKVDAIWPPWGGELAMEVLPLLDYAALREARPKWILGFSDVSTVAVALASKLGWATAHSPNLMDMAPNAADGLTEHTLSHLATPLGQSFTQTATQLHSATWPDFEANVAAVLKPDTPTQWRWLNPERAIPKVSGSLIGGCWDTMIHLFDTDYLDLVTFKQNSSGKVLLFLENVEMSPFDLSRALLNMKFRGVFEQIDGLLLGRNSAKDADNLSYLEVLHRHLDELEIPVIIDIDFGHVPPNLTLVNGAYAEVVMGEVPRITQTLV